MNTTFEPDEPVLGGACTGLFQTLVVLSACLCLWACPEAKSPSLPSDATDLYGVVDAADISPDPLTNDARVDDADQPDQGDGDAVPEDAADGDADDTGEDEPDGAEVGDVGEEVTDVSDIGGDLDASDVSDTSDADSADAVDLNPCGGTQPLSFKDTPAVPGAACGECSDGVLMCRGQNNLFCFFPSEVNACGGCGRLPGDDQDDCGPCDDDVYACEGALMVCGSQDRNGCGGCGTLSDQPGGACDLGDSELGLVFCSDNEAVACIGDGENACGGTLGLGAVPGEPCGQCNLGTRVCDGENSVDCQDGDAGVNECGGCGPLQGAVGDDCGLCGGTWACGDDGDVICVDSDRNPCGGCSALPGDPGDVCDDGMRLACAGLESLVCVSDDVNACSGEAVLDDVPGAPCGDCGDGFLVCASPEQLVCAGGSPLNACGGCRVLGTQVGASCGARHRMACQEGELRCLEDEGANLCGGDEELEERPGAACDDCGSAVWACDGREDVDCVGEIVVRDGCGVCGGTGGSLWFRDTDGDGLGDPDHSQTACTKPDDYVDNADDLFPGCHDDDLDDCDVCDGPGPPTWYADQDSDGQGDPATFLTQCLEPTAGKWVSNSLDQCPTGGQQDSEGTCCESDSLDCAGICFGAAVRDACEVCGGPGKTRWYDDTDGDGKGNPIIWQDDCSQPNNYVDNADDTRPDCHDSLIDNCGLCDGPDEIRWWPDTDNDDYGETQGGSEAPVDACEVDAPTGWVDNDDDAYLGCDDDTVPTWYRDQDEDGEGDPNQSRKACEQPEDYVGNRRDDEFPDCHNDQIACGSCPATTPTWYEDQDGDGKGDPDSFITQCTEPDGVWVLNSNDACPDHTNRAPDTDGACCELIEEDCLGLCFGSAVLDCSTEEAAPDGVCGGTAAIDVCGVCSGGTTGIEPGAHCPITLAIGTCYHVEDSVGTPIRTDVEVLMTTGVRVRSIDFSVDTANPRADTPVQTAPAARGADYPPSWGPPEMGTGAGRVVSARTSTDQQDDWIQPMELGHLLTLHIRVVVDAGLEEFMKVQPSISGVENTEGVGFDDPSGADTSCAGWETICEGDGCVF